MILTNWEVMYTIDFVKKSLLLLPIISLPFLFLFVKEWYLNFYVVSAMTSVTSYLICMNFPFISKIMHTRGLNYEDLADRKALTRGEKYQYQMIFLQIINVPLAFFITALVDYALFRFTHTVLNTQEVLGILGGLGSAYVSFHEIVGKMLIMCLHKKKVKNIKKRKMSEVSESEKEIEMINSV